MISKLRLEIRQNLHLCNASRMSKISSFFGFNKPKRHFQSLQVHQRKMSAWNPGKGLTARVVNTDLERGRVWLCIAAFYSLPWTEEGCCWTNHGHLSLVLSDTCIKVRAWILESVTFASSNKLSCCSFSCVALRKSRSSADFWSICSSLLSLRSSSLELCSSWLNS